MAGLIITGGNYAIQAFSSKLPDLSQAREGRGLNKTISRPAIV